MAALIHTLCAITLLLAAPIAAKATETITHPDLLQKLADNRSLAQDPYWIALGHYLPANNESGFLSEITSSGFFLSTDGAHDPRKELEATLNALFLPTTNNPDQHAQCRFIARFHWLKKKLGLESLALPNVVCNQYQEWTSNGQIESLSLVFATGYLDNPASFYGHLLLKLNTQRDVLANELLDQSINYGAAIPADENPFAYVFHGLFGGYDANFSDGQFYRHNLNYGENELRDMWEYELALEKDEVQQIIHHSWELLDNTFTYYFFKKNCAYRMAKLLELVIDESLLPQELPWSIPSSVFDSLMRIEKRGRPLVSKVRLIPSRQNRFYEKYFSLTTNQQNLIHEITKTELNLEQTNYQKLSDGNKIDIIDSLFDYYEFRMAREDDDTIFKRAKQQLLVERAALPAGGGRTVNHNPQLSPSTQGPLPGLFRPGLVHSKSLGSGLELQFRPAYYDNLGVDPGRLPDSRLTMFDLRTLYRDGKLTLRSLDFIDVQTLNVSRTGLPGDGGRAWSLRVGVVNQDLSCDGCNVLRATGGIGKAMSLARNNVFYGMVEGLAQTSYRNSGTLGASVKLGLWATPLSGWKSHFVVDTRGYLNGGKSRVHILRWENRFGYSRHWDIRLKYEKEVESEVSAALSLYW